MIRDDLRAGVPAGFLAAAATAGALIAIGSRATTAARPFNVIAGHLLGGRADAYGFLPSVTIPGIVLHIALTTLAGVAVAAIVQRRLASPWTAAGATSLLAALVSVGIAQRGGRSLAGTLTLGDLLLLYVTMTASLALGIRFAFFTAPENRVNHVEPM
jgi:hypothetical protein